jgi:hypothetical protein
VRLEGLGQLNNSNDLIENLTRDLPACSIVPELTTDEKTNPYGRARNQKPVVNFALRAYI